MTEQDKQNEITMGNRGLVLHDLDSMQRFAQMVLSSNMAPKAYKVGTSAQQIANVCVAVQYGLELGFSVGMAKKANLWGKHGPWTQYPDRMLQNRARSFALRDAFADVLRGVISTEEARDIPNDEPRDVEVTPVVEVIDEDQTLRDWANEETEDE